MRNAWLLGLMGCVSLGGCILEDNPLFVESAETGGSGSSGGTTTPLPTTDSTDPTLTTSADSTGTTSGDPSDSSDTGGPPLPEGPGCNDPSVCTVLHIGPIEGSCPHEVDGVPTDECDEVGAYALRIAAATLEFQGGGGQIIMHDNGGIPASYVGSLDVARKITIRVADGLSPEAVVVFSQDTDGVLRMRGDEVHLQGFTVACRAGGDWALTFRTDFDTEGTETSGHLIEGLVMAGTRPENVGSNSIVWFLQSLGSDTIVRNNYVWGYFEGTIDMRFASRSVFAHNTVVYYQAQSGPLIDASEADDLEISNNVFASLTHPTEVFVSANDSTTGLLMVGNWVEGVSNLLGGLETTDPDIVYEDNVGGPLELQSPRNPRVLADSTMTASSMATSEGVSVDGVDLAGAAVVLPGAYQNRSTLSLPRRSVVTVGESMCGLGPCDFTKTLDNELQRAAWSMWPGGTVEVHPSVTPYAGPVVISWPITLRGMGQQPDEVVVVRDIEDGVLDGVGIWDGKDVVVDLTRNMGSASLVENITIDAASDQIGLYHEGSTGAQRHEIRRVILRDDGTVAGDPAAMALWLGNNVVVHDVLVHGGYRSCVRFGPRASGSQTTPAVTAWVHHLTCRLTEAVPRESTVAAFEVAAVANVVIADAVVDLFEPGPLFRAQRRSSGDSDITALDIPTSFVAHSISARGYDVLFDGFTAMDGLYTLTAVDMVGAMEPLFVDALDSRLMVGAVGIDGGVDPNTLELGLSLGVTVDGIDRLGLTPDRGAYEQGL